MQRQQAANKITYDTSNVVQGKLVQTVEVTGDIKPTGRIDLSFKAGGTLKAINTKVGDSVKQNQVLAELTDSDLQFAYQRSEAVLAAAQANLAARQAGETTQSIAMAQATVEQAQASYNKSLSDLDATKIQVQNDLQSAQVALDTAQNNLNNATPISDQNLKNAIENARVSLANALGPLSTALVDGDTVSGVDDTATNLMYKQYLGALSNGTLDQAKASYAVAKGLKNSAQASVDLISTASTKESVMNAADNLQRAIDAIQNYILDVKTVLANTITSTYFTNMDLAAKKTVIDVDYSAVAAQKTGVTGVHQAMDLAGLNNTSDKSKLQDAYNSAKIAFQNAQNNVQTKISAAQTSATIQKAALDSAKAALDLKKAPPRAVDIAALRAQVLDAQTAHDQAFSNLTDAEIIAPINGIVSEIIPDLGEQIIPNTPQIRLVSSSTYDIEARVPEADIAKIKIGQLAQITLDAYGDEVKFQGTVTSEDPDQTKIQDAIYYNISVTMDPAGRTVKPGMTANVTITTASLDNALIIPSRAIKTDITTNQKSVQILVNGQPVTKEITTGQKGDQGTVQVLSGLSGGDKVVMDQKIGP